MQSVLWLWACKLYEGQAIHPKNFFWPWSIYRGSLWSCTVKHPPAGEQLMKGSLRSTYTYWKLINSHTWSYKEYYSCGLSLSGKIFGFVSLNVASPTLEYFFCQCSRLASKANVLELTIVMANKILGSK